MLAAGEIGDRSRRELGPDGLAYQKGCRNAIELLERVTLIGGLSANQRLKLGAQLHPDTTLSGEALPGRFPQVAEALTAGWIGIDAAAAIVKGLQPANAHPDELAAAEAELVAAATGTHPTGPDPDTDPDADPAADADPDATPVAPLPCAADEIAIQASVWRAVIDPDGLQPSEERAMRSRMFGKGHLRDGLVRGQYALLPEIAAKLDRLFDAYLSPNTTGVFLTDDERATAEALGDDRTPDQQRHDVLAALVDGHARSGKAPSIGGASPTVLVSVKAEDLNSGRGPGWIDGLTTPISMAAINQLTCTGGIQPVRFDSFGRIIELGTKQRVFTPAQRRAINLRDGSCICCNIPAGWTEIHHVLDWAKNGLTHTDNGVSLCWFHHRTIETSGWDIRMIRGVPHLKAPPWIDPTGTWRPASKARTDKGN
ncbi:HNH endonuclease signature motif containing protein [Salinibacterium sp. ZJ454]|uniref:HNH endonuclease signature motif containing protein n=1 Tax=Salinibacterium sp. ZJ454 TaxID=2708339 RepID=UPI0014242201|nr:HNH endonuclease signature motif containing protein [Salinibacterium sp. ZJ454]